MRRSRRPKVRQILTRLMFESLEPRLNLALDVPAFSSLPGANHTIYLDFDGHVTTGTSWNSSYGVTTINSPSYSSDADHANFSASELLVIERTFKRVSEDFAPFQVNVTTVAPTVDDLRNSGGGDTKWGVRVVVSDDVAFNCGCGGIAYINSFMWSSDTPVFVFNTSELGVSEAASHEVGHSLGLSHDGTASASYYTGHGLGSDTTYWAPLMGVSYNVNVSQWDKGEYFGTNNGASGANYGRGPDDLAIITTYNGFGYKTDDHGNTQGTASTLAVAGSTVSGSGLISTRTDVDYFQFTTSAGNVTLNVNPVTVGPNLDIEASLYDSSGTLIATNNALMSLNAIITANVSAGQYYLKVDGVGAGNPTVSPPTGYSDYASLGQYTIAGTITAVNGDTLSISAIDASKNEGNSGSTAYTFTVNRTGDTSVTSTVNYAVAGSGTSPASASDFVGGFLSGSLTFNPGVTSLPITVNVQGDTDVESNETFLVSLSSPGPTTTIGTTNATGTILNDDTLPPPPGYSISATNASKAEGTGSAATPFTFTIFRMGDLTSAGSVVYTVSGSGASKANKSDFVGGFPRNVKVNFPANVSSVDININVVADNRQEPNEGFRVTLSSPVGGTISVGTADGSIIDDDGTGTGEVDEADLIAVADPLWLFVPAEYLTAEQLAVPVTTWINGVSYVGDLAHDHDHDHDHETEDDFGQSSVLSFAAPLDTNAGTQRVSSLTKTDSRVITVSAKNNLDRGPARNAESIVQSKEAVESLVDNDDSSTADLPAKRRARLTARRAAAVDEVLGGDHADWLDLSTILS